MEECLYHICIDELAGTINELVGIYHNNGNGYLECWLCDESHFDKIYLDKIEEYAHISLSESERGLVKKKGSNLEKVILRWLNAEQVIHIIHIQNSIREYIINQFKKDDLKDLFDNCSC